MPKLKSPLRYPGGKQKVSGQIFSYLPYSFDEYREPFVGGGSVALKVLENNLNCLIWINDLNPEVYYFWQQIRDNLHNLAKEVSQVYYTPISSGKELFHSYAEADNINELSALERAVRFFVLNRISYSGTIECGGYSESAFKHRFTLSSIQRLYDLGNWLENVKITNLDYAELVNAPGKNVMIYLDPPYLTASKSRLYGKRGSLHTNFDHQKFAKIMSECPHKWLITYDDCEEIRQLFAFANIKEWRLQYSMNGCGNKAKLKGKELIITNY